MRETLRRQAPRSRDNPRVVLLTRGPASKYYVEDAQLARYIGYTLVEGGDLTARGDRIWLKTLGGLLEVDVIVRRQGDDDCDPLELRSDSLHGVPGWLEVVRAGHVLVANAIGSALAQAPALTALLPTLAREWFGEDLLLPAVESAWCGDESACRRALERLSQLVIRPAYGWGKSIYGGELSWVELEALRTRIAQHPARYVARLWPTKDEIPGNGNMADHHHAEHVQGSMDIRAQEKTFAGFIRVSVWVAGLAIAVLIFLALANS